MKYECNKKTLRYVKVLWSTTSVATSVLVCYEPGNATRYVAVFTRMVGPIDWGMGDQWCVALPGQSFNCSMVLPGHARWIESDYVGDKMGLRTGDALPVAALIRYVAEKYFDKPEE